jgi:hypothetical protein
MHRSQFVANILLLAALTAGAFAQEPETHRYTSPPAASSGIIGGKRITINYYSPSMHGRKIFGELVPFGKVWATGANVATKITTEAPLKIGDLNVPKGEYSIWTIPGEKEWTLILNKETGQFHLNYNANLDFGRTKMKISALPSPVEALHIGVRSESGNKGALFVDWETTEASVPVTAQ